MPSKEFPVIKWGTFYDEKSVAHIAPAIDGFLMKGHILDWRCKCSPMVDKGKGYHIVVHYVIH